MTEEKIVTQLQERIKSQRDHYEAEIVKIQRQLDLANRRCGELQFQLQFKEVCGNKDDKQITEDNKISKNRRRQLDSEFDLSQSQSSQDWSALESQLQSYKTELERMRQEYDKIEDQRDELTEQNSKLRAAQQETLTTVEALTSELSATKTELQASEEKRAQLECKFSDMEADLTSTIASNEATIRELNAQLQEMTVLLEQQQHSTTASQPSSQKSSVTQSQSQSQQTEGSTIEAATSPSEESIFKLTDVKPLTEQADMDLKCEVEAREQTESLQEQREALYKAKREFEELKQRFFQEREEQGQAAIAKVVATTQEIVSSEVLETTEMETHTPTTDNQTDTTSNQHSVVQEITTAEFATIADLEDLRRQLAAATDEQQVLVSERDSLASLKQTLEYELDKLKEDFAVLEKESQHRAERLEAERQTLMDEMREMQRQNADLQAQLDHIAQLQAESQQLQQQRQEQKTDGDQDTDMVDDMISTTPVGSQNNNNHESGLEELKQENELLKNELESVLAELATHKSNTALLEADISANQERSGTLTDEVNSLKALLEQRQADKQTLEQQNAELVKQLAELEKDTTTQAENSRTAWEQTKQDIEAENARLQQQVNQLQESLDEQTQSQTQHEAALEELKTLREAKDKAAQLLLDRQQELQQATLDLQTQSVRYSELEERHNQLAARITELQSLNAQYDSELSDLKVKATARDGKMEEEFLKKCNEAVSFELRAKELQVESSKLRAENDRLIDELNSAHSAVRSAEQLQRDLETRVAELEQRTQEAKMKYNARSEELAVLTEKTESFDMERNNLQASLDAATKRVQDLKHQLERDRENFTDTLSAKNEEVENIDKQLKQHKEQLRKLQSEANSLNVSVTKLTGTIDVLEREKSKLKAEHEHLTEQLASTRKQLTEAETKLLKFTAQAEAAAQWETKFHVLQETLTNRGARAIAAASEPAVIGAIPNGTSDSGRKEKAKQQDSVVIPSVETQEQEQPIVAKDSTAKGTKRSRSESTAKAEESTAASTMQPKAKKARGSTDENAEVSAVVVAQAPSVDDAVSPQKTRKRKEAPKVYITFSGFKDNIKVYTLAYRDELAKLVQSINGEVVSEQGADKDRIDESITHVIAPPSSRTIKTLAAALTKRWVVTPEWVKASAQAGKFVDEAPYGYRNSVSPFYNKKFYLSATFNHETTSNQRKQHCSALIQTFGGGEITPSLEPADFVLVGQREPLSTYTNKHCLTWDQFIDHIHPRKLDANQKTTTAQRTKSTRQAAATSATTPKTSPKADINQQQQQEQQTSSPTGDGTDGGEDEDSTQKKRRKRRAVK